MLHLICAENAQQSNGETRQTIPRRPCVARDLQRYRAHISRRQRDDGRLGALRSALQQARQNDRKAEQARAAKQLLHAIVRSRAMFANLSRQRPAGNADEVCDDVARRGQKQGEREICDNWSRSSRHGVDSGAKSPCSRHSKNSFHEPRRPGETLQLSLVLDEGRTMDACSVTLRQIALTSRPAASSHVAVGQQSRNRS